MYAARPRYPLRPRYPARPSIGQRQQILPGDIYWKLKWPFITSKIIGAVVLIFSLVIISLEIATLAISNDTAYGRTASTGSGIWGGFFIFSAGMLILSIRPTPNIRQLARSAFIATIVAACFSIAIIGLDAKAVKDGVDIGNLYQFLTGTYYFFPKYRVLAAQLAFACAEFFLCIAFIIIYIAVLISSPKSQPPPRR